MITGRRLHSVRVEVGRTLAREYPVEADLVIPVPESGTPAAIGYAEAVRDPVRAGAGQELLRRPHLHPAQPDHPPARHPAQAEPAPRRDRRQAAGGGRRLDRPRQHPARPGPDAARGRRDRGARADLLAAGEVALLLRHRLRQPGRADRQRSDRRRDLPLDRRRLAGLRQPGRAWSRPPRRAWTSSAGPASTASTRSSCRWPSDWASTCSRSEAARTGVDGLTASAAGVGAADALARHDSVQVALPGAARTPRRASAAERSCAERLRS